MDAAALQERARRVHEAALVVDAHADTPTEFFLRPGYDLAALHPEGHVDLPRLRRGGVDAQFFVAWAPAETAATPGAALAHVLRLIEAIHQVAGRTPGIRLAASAAEVRAAAAEGDIAALIGVEGGHAIENSLDNLRRFHALGARYLTLTWNNANDWADASCSPPRHGGLTAFGREVVREMNRLGMLVDLSHASDETVRDVLATTRAPVIASHSNARALARHPRNLTDTQIREIAATGGVVGINFFPTFLDEAYAPRYHRIDEAARIRERRLRARGVPPGQAGADARAWRQRRLDRLPPVPIDAVADHIDHIARVGGIDHVGLGSDFDGIATVPAGLEDAAALPHLTELLLRRGYGPAELEKILGGNLLRVLGTVSA